MTWTQSPRISVCIPAYNRPDTLRELLDSILVQWRPDIEVIVCEDCSPARECIAAVVGQAQKRYPEARLSYHENVSNLGYDGNLRRLLELATGDYCLFMGDDDLVCRGALDRVIKVVDRYPQVGVINRAYQIVDRFTGAVYSENRYYEGDRLFPAGVEAVVSFYRRVITVSGLTVHRQRALDLATDRHDGTVLYQLYLVANLLLESDGYYISDFLVLRRKAIDHFFGTSPAEKGLFDPDSLTPQHSVTFMRGMLSIAKDLERNRGVQVHDRIVADLAAYAYPFLADHSRPRSTFIGYVRELARLGLGRSPWFWINVGLLLTLDRTQLHQAIEAVKRIRRKTPRLSPVYQGLKVED